MSADGNQTNNAHTMEIEYPLTKDQRTIFDIIENNDGNYLVHGKPGVGKTVLTQALKEYGVKNWIICAPTGLAAQLAGGKTLHSQFGIPVSNGIFTLDFNKFTQNENVINNVLHTVKHLIIDEVSMVRADMLDYVERMLRHVKQNDKPFGGVQVVLVGDFFQLPPIAQDVDMKQLKAEGYRSEFAFDAQCFATFSPLVLTEVLRQKGDAKFIELLHAARTGSMSPAQIKLLNKRVEPCTDMRIKLAAKNRQAEAINLKSLADIHSTECEYHATAFGKWPQYPAETILRLKVGAQVIIKKNGADIPPGTKRNISDSEIVNGSLGIVEEMHLGTATMPRRVVVVKLRNGKTATIYSQRWEQKEKLKIGSEWTERVVASFEQIPLQLAWAISMHKSQGQSFEFVHVNPSSVFADGQLYVALSRARSMSGLSLQHPVSAHHFMVNERVLEFVQHIERKDVKSKKRIAA